MATTETGDVAASGSRKARIVPLTCIGGVKAGPPTIVKVPEMWPIADGTRVVSAVPAVGPVGNAVEPSPVHAARTSTAATMPADRRSFIATEVYGSLVCRSCRGGPPAVRTDVPLGAAPAGRTPMVVRGVGGTDQPFARAMLLA